MTTTAERASLEQQPHAKADFMLLRAALWSVCLYVGFGLLGFAVFAGFWPPPSQDLDAAGIAQYFQTHGTAIRIGMVLMVVGAPCYYTRSVALSKIISRSAAGAFDQGFHSGRVPSTPRPGAPVAAKLTQ